MIHYRRYYYDNRCIRKSNCQNVYRAIFCIIIIIMLFNGPSKEFLSVRLYTVIYVCLKTVRDLHHRIWTGQILCRLKIKILTLYSLLILQEFRYCSLYSLREFSIIYEWIILWIYWINVYELIFYAIWKLLIVLIIVRFASMIS